MYYIYTSDTLIHTHIFTALLPNSVKCYKQWFYGVMVLVPDVGWIGLSVALCLKQFVSRLWIYSKLSKPVELYFEIKYTDLKLQRFEKLKWVSESEGRSIVSDSLRRHGLYSPRNPPGQDTEVVSLSLLQGIFPTQGSSPGLWHCRQILYQLNHKGSLSQHLVKCLQNMWTQLL